MSKDKELTMKLGTLSMLSAAALLAGGMSIAAAQSGMAPNNKNSNSPGMSSTSAGKCWDAATNTVKDKSTQTASGQKRSGGVTTGTGASGNAANSAGAKPMTRPAGMANC
jgi:hypothetical protein